jgi:hypothetical protein
MLMNFDFFKGKPQLSGAFLSILLSELILSPLEIGQFLFGSL